MKKLLVSVLAIAGLVACHNEEAVRMPENSVAIAFVDAFVENNATRAAEDPSTTTASIAAFDVWSWMDDKDGLVLGGLDAADYNGGENVKKENGVWVYENVQYWTPDHDFYFVAVAPMDSVNWKYDYDKDTIEFTNVDGTEDLLYDYKKIGTWGKEINDSYDAVSLQFAHLLAKTKFTFINGFATKNMYVEISEISMTAPKTATYDISTEQWGVVDGNIALAYGGVENTSFGQKNESTYERLTIPASKEQEYVVTYTITVYRNTVEDYKVTKTSTITGVELKRGKSYNFVAEISPETLDMQAIEFKVEVDTWIEEDVNGGAIEETVKVVSTIDELQAALYSVNGDTSIVLGDNLVGNVTVPEYANTTVAINGNGFTFNGYMYIDGNSNDDKGAVTVFDNMKFVTNNSSAYPGTAFIYCGEDVSTNDRYPNSIVVKNCSFDDTSASADPKTVAVKFWTLYDKLVIENSTANGLHSLVQATSSKLTANILIDGVKVNAKNGISLDSTVNTFIRNSEIVATGYGIRANGDRVDVANLTIEDTKITAPQPVIVRKLTSTHHYNVALINAELNTVDRPYHVVFTNGNDSATYAAPKGTFNLTGAEGYLVYPTHAAASNTELEDALANATPGSVIVLAEDVNFGDILLGKLEGVTIVSDQNATMRFVTDANTNIKDVTVKNAEVVSESTAWKDSAFVVIDPNAQIENLVVEDCSIVGTGVSRSAGIFGENKNASLVVKNCNFSNLNYAIYKSSNLGGYASLTFENCSFENINSWVMLVNYGYNGDLTVTDCTFDSCSDGLVKTTAFNGSAFNFTNNTITNSAGHDGKDTKWFDVTISASTLKEISGNTKDGVAWTPDSANGLK